EGANRQLHRGPAQIEPVEIEMESLAGSHRAAIQVVGSENERTRPVRQAAGAGCSRGSKHQRVLAGFAPVAIVRVNTFRDAGELMEDGSERTTQLVAGSTRKGNGSAR